MQLHVEARHEVPGCGIHGAKPGVREGQRCFKSPLCGHCFLKLGTGLFKSINGGFIDLTTGFHRGGAGGSSRDFACTQTGDHSRDLSVHNAQMLGGHEQ